MTIFLQLLLAHLIGDFCFQSDKTIENKEKKKIKSPQLYIHLAIHTLALIVTLGFEFKYWPAILIIIISHWIIDLFKLYFQTSNNKQRLFFLDQLLHISVLLLVAKHYEYFKFSWDQLLTQEVLLMIICLVFVTFVSSIVIQVIISKWNPETNDDDGHSLKKAGQYIGVLERLFVFIFIILNHWEAVGFLLAAKSVFRFGDLSESKDRKLTEYILIGTLLSFGLAILAALVYLGAMAK